MIRLTSDELRLLGRFNNGAELPGNGDWLIDHLACRGLLVRSETVAPIHNRHDKPQVQRSKQYRASYCHYTITRRGMRALSKHQLVEV
ncbi:hypothetical protein Rctr85_039 [Virus Rctr85]|nr:hypothetical protein Rctr85_039 [Virus Rctr85]